MNRKDLCITTLILLMAAASILPHLGDLTMRDDELFSVLHSSRSVEFLFKDRDLTWPPGYYLILNLWMRAVGMNDVAVRLLGGLGGVLAVAFIYRVGKRLHAREAGWLAALAFGTSSYAAYFLVEARGYTLCITLGAVIALLHLRWMARPCRRRAIPYMLAQIFVIYLHYTGWVIVAAAGLHVLLRAPRRLWRWAVIMGVTALTFMPMVPQFLDGSRARVGTTSSTLTLLYRKEPIDLYRAYSAHADLLLAGLVLLACAGMVYARRTAPLPKAGIAWLAAWGLGVPLLAYLTNAQTDMFKPRYLALTMPGVFLLLGLGLARLPRSSRVLGAVMLLGVALMPWQPGDFRSIDDSYDVKGMVRYLARNFAPGDRLIADPGCGHCRNPRAWAYYEALYFPGGRIPRAVDGYAEGSVWYLLRKGSETPDIKASVEAGRIRTDAFWGPWDFIVTRYEQAPLTPGYALGDGGLHFRGATLSRPPAFDFSAAPFYLPGDTIHVQSWWSTDAQLPLDYSIGLYLVQAHNQKVEASVDSGPVGAYAGGQTSQWTPGMLYRDTRTIQIPWRSFGDYELWMAVYHWADQVRLMPEPGTPQALGAVVIGRFRVESWAVYR